MADERGGNVRVTPGGDEYSYSCSGSLYEGRMVEPDTSYTTDPTIKLATENSRNVLGYVQNDWEAGDKVAVYDGGIARLEDGGSGITVGALVGCAGSGKVQTLDVTAASGAVVGVALETISSAGFGKVLVRISHPTPSV